MEADKISLSDFYAGQTIFITGASGFMGKVLLEKILYSFPNLNKIYIMMRPKRGRTVEQRLEDWSNNPVFSRLFAKYPDTFSKKLVAFPGDITEENLGLSDYHREVLKDEVTMIFHCAATLKLEANLKDAILFNTLGTWKLIELCREMKNLKILVHLSTAFCHCDHEVLEEQIYPSPHDPQELIRCVQWLDDESLNLITKRLLGPHPNTYTYSKRLAERLIGDEYGRLPTVIARPSIVVPSVNEPIPGWVDSLNGPIGISVGAGKGVIRSLYAFEENRAEVIPVDFAINGLITLAWQFCINPKPAEIPVYNINTAAKIKERQTTWGQVLEMGRKLVPEYPFEMTIWYPDGNIRRNKFMHNLCVIFMHFLPAYFIDLLLFLFLQKRFMVRLQWKIYEGLNLLQYFTTRKWVFKTKNFEALSEKLIGSDQDTFTMDCDKINLRTYMRDSLLGARQFCMKEDLSSLPRCRRNIKILYAIHVIFLIFVYYFIGYMLYSLLGTTKTLLDASVKIFERAPIIRSLSGNIDGKLDL